VYDYIVIGAGSAGCVLASRLTETRDCSVALIEAGPPDRKREIHIPAAFSKLFKTSVDWNYITEPQEHLNGRRLYWPRGKMLGGSAAATPISTPGAISATPAGARRMWLPFSNPSRARKLLAI
jgi:choline dehydrogenase